MTAKTTNRRTAMSGFLGSKTFERLLIVAAVAAVLVAFGAWYAMARPAEADAAAARSTAAAGAPAATATEAPAAEAPAAGTPAPETPAAEGPAAAPSSAAEAPAAPVTEEAPDGPGAAAPAAATAEPAPQAFLDEVTDSGLAPPVDDAQKLAMARDVCEEMGYGATPDDMVRALTFAGASDEEAANFVDLAVTNICPEHAA